MGEGKELKEKLFAKKECGWNNVEKSEMDEIFRYADGYIDFLNKAKTEREAVDVVKGMAIAKGFKCICECDELKPGDKVFYSNRGKSIYLAVIGEEKLEKGLNVIGAHIDSPRLDLKPNPLYEDGELALFKTHYYGGIKKYQWTAIPLAIHGVIVKANGEKITVNIGEDPRDPIFTITDLLPHLAIEQMDKKLRSAIDGENLNLLIGSIPYNDKEVSERIKLNTLNILNEKYGITESDFLSSELELVPAFNARTLGFDWSMVAGYGQDDRVCAYTSLTAMLNIERPKTTAVCILSDKEEVGSMGNTGMESHVFDTFISELLNKTGENRPNLLDKVFCNSKMLSADVGAAMDPTYSSVSDRYNAAMLGKGVSFDKYTGSRGKAGGSDANAEFVAEVRGLLEENNIKYQITELGKVDVGGGGTIAYILADKGMEVIDCGVPVLSMHAPYEVTSKYDVYSAFKTYEAFWRK